MASIAFASTETVAQQVPNHIDAHPHDGWDAYMPEMAYNMTLVFNDPPAVDPSLHTGPYPHLLPGKQHVGPFTQFPMEQVQVPQVPSQEQIVKPESPLDVTQNVPQVCSYASQKAFHAYYAQIDRRIIRPARRSQSREEALTARRGPIRGWISS